MPADDTAVPPRARSPLAARALLLAALCAGLGGLALPSGPTTPLTAAAALQERPERLVLTPVAAAPQPLLVVRHATRATRSRRLAPRWVRPVAAGIVSPYGWRWGRPHEGVDFGAHYGAPIHAVGDGVVIGAGYLADEGGYGQIVLVRHAGGVITAYAHMSRVLVRSGERVHAGDLLGRVGSTGHVTGPHLHFEVRIGGAKVNPVPWLRRHGVRV